MLKRGTFSLVDHSRLNSAISMILHTKSDL